MNIRNLRIACASYILAGIVAAFLILTPWKNEYLEIQQYIEWWQNQPNTIFDSIGAWVGGLAFVTSLATAAAMLVRPPSMRIVFALSLLILTLSEVLISIPPLRMPIQQFLDSMLGIVGGIVVGFSFSTHRI